MENMRNNKYKKNKYNTLCHEHAAIPIIFLLNGLMSNDFSIYSMVIS